MVRALLTSWKIKTSRGLLKYLKDGERSTEKAREYYLGHNKAADHWGRGAERMLADFGLKEFSDQTWENLFEGKAPDGSKLMQTNQGKHVPGVDAVFSPPKSLSCEMIYATEARRQEIEDAHLAAVKAALELLQDKAKPCPVTVDGKKVRVEGDLIVFLATHHTARPTKETIERGSPPDPMLHTHAFIANAAWSHGKWRSVDQYRLLGRQKEARYVYESTLTDSLRGMGYKIDFHEEDRRGNRSWELAGSDKAFRDFFSTRSRERDTKVRDFEKEYGRPPTYGETVALLQEGREGKTHECAEPSWDAYAAAAEKGGHQRPNHERGANRVMSRGLEERRTMAYEHLMSPKGMTSQDATLPRWMVGLKARAAAFGILSCDETDEWLDWLEASGELLVVEQAEKGDPDHDTITTRANLRQEYEATATAICMAYEKGPAPSKRAVDDALRNVARKSGFALDAEQIAAVRHMTSSARWAHLVGHAGTGKSTCMKSMIAAYKAEGLIDRVIVVSVAGSTAQRIGESLNADGCYTVEGLAMAAQKVTERTLVILDEVVMTDTPRLSVFTKVCRKAIVRAVGDPMQLEAIGAGGGFASIDEAIGHMELTKVHRQTDEVLVSALGDIRAGRIAPALDAIDRLGGLHVSDDYEHAVGELLHRYNKMRVSGIKTDDILVITDAPNTEIDRLNRLIQDKRREWGELGKDAITLEATVDKRVESFHKGDLIAFTEGYEDSEHNVRVRNGTRGVVTRVAPWGLVVRTHKGEDVSVYVSKNAPKVNTSDERVDAVNTSPTQPIRLAYAGHAVRTQGHEAKIGLVLPWLQTTDRGSAYSMCTRAKDELFVFLGGKREALESAWKIWNPKKSAETRMSESDYEWEAPEPMLRKKRGLERV